MQLTPQRGFVPSRIVCSDSFNICYVFLVVAAAVAANATFPSVIFFHLLALLSIESVRFIYRRPSSWIFLKCLPGTNSARHSSPITNKGAKRHNMLVSWECACETNSDRKLSSIVVWLQRWRLAACVCIRLTTRLTHLDAEGFPGSGLTGPW